MESVDWTFRSIVGCVSLSSISYTGWLRIDLYFLIETE